MFQREPVDVVVVVVVVVVVEPLEFFSENS